MICIVPLPTSRTLIVIRFVPVKDRGTCRRVVTRPCGPVIAVRAVFVLVTGVPWRMVPKEIGCSGVTASRRLRDWQAADVWQRLHRELLRRLNAAGQIDWSRGTQGAR